MIAFTHYAEVWEEICRIYEAALNRAYCVRSDDKALIALALGQEKTRADYEVLGMLERYFGEDKDNEKS